MNCHSYAPCTSVRLPFDPSSVAVARKLLAAALEEARIDEEVAADAKVVLSELVTNGVLHGEPVPPNHIEVCWLLTDARLRVSVLDAGKARTLTPNEPDPYATNGRGLAIIDYMCDSWEVSTKDGTRLIAELAIA